MNPQDRHKRTLRRVQIAGHAVTTVFECYVLLEILWYYTHDGTQTFHDAAAEWWEAYRQRARERARIRDTRDMIRDLPET